MSNNRLGEYCGYEEIDDQIAVLRCDLSAIDMDIRERLQRRIEELLSKGNPEMMQLASEAEDLKFQAFVCSRTLEEDPHYQQVRILMTLLCNDPVTHIRTEDLFETRKRIRKVLRALEKIAKKIKSEI